MNDLGLPLEDQPERLDQHGPIFILGCPRSGTTFLANCLARLDEVESFVGIIAPPRLMHLLGRVPDDETSNELMLSIRDTFWQSFWRRRLSRPERLGLALAGQSSWLDVRRAPGIQDGLFMYKEPFLCFAAEKFARQFTAARFIHIIRDGRDNADSMERTYPDALADHVLSDERMVRNKNSEIGMSREINGLHIPWWVPETEHEMFMSAERFGRCLMMWREMTLRARALSTIGSRRYIEIRYDALVNAPQAELEALCKFISAKPNGRMRKFAKSASKSSVGISSQRMTPERKAIAEQVAGPLLRSLGYD